MPTTKVSKINIEGLKRNMNTLLVIFINMIFVFNGFVCGSSKTDGAKNDPLPDSRPDNFAVNYSLSGGMRYYSESIYISRDSCYYSVNESGSISKIYFKISDGDLDKLYNTFRDNKFYKIKTYEQEVYDRGGESISISWGNGKYANVSDGGMTFIEKTWQNEWSGCLNAVKQIAAAETAKQKKDYMIKIDKSFFGKTLYVSIEQEVLIPESTITAESDMDSYITKTAKLLPGAHRLQILWDKKFSQNLSINTDSTKGISILLDKDTIKTTFIK